MTDLPGHERPADESATRTHFEQMVDQWQEEIWEAVLEEGIKNLESIVGAKKLPDQFWTPPPGFRIPRPEENDDG